MSKAVVIGAGIGGLTAAIALRQKGWEVTVLERAEKLEPVGSGLAIAANGLKALDTIGLGDQVRALSRVQGTAGLRSSDGRWLTRTTEDRAAERYGDSVVMLLRSTMVDLLLARLGRQALGLGTEVLAAEDGRVVTAEGELTADLVVAADGIHSATRRALFPGHSGLKYAGTTAWRILVHAPGLKVRATETWGRGMVVGVMPLADDIVYLYATDALPAGTEFADERAELLRRFGGWHEPIATLLARSDNSRIIRNDLYHLATPLPALHSGRIALLGDAAHPMTPNLGQGANQALEDAVVLAALAEGDLAAYTAARLKRTAMVVRRSAAISRMTMVRNPLAVLLRDRVMGLAGRLSPDLMLRSMDEVMGWAPPREAWSGREPAARA